LVSPDSPDAHIPGGVFGSVGYPPDLAFVATHGAGARMWSTDGREFVDYVLGSGPLVLGHAHPRVVEAIQRQALAGTHFYSMNEPALRLASRIVEHVPCAEAVKFVGDGAQATFYALRLARAFTGRTKIVKFEGAYHGHHDYVQHGLSAGDGANTVERKANSAGIPPELSKTVLVVPFNDLEAVTRLMEVEGPDVAAILIEPIQRAIMPEPGFLAGLRALCDRTGALLIFDEVVSGFRLALGGAQEAFGVTPDLCALGKIIGGGLPMAAVAGRRDVLELSLPGRRDDGRSIYLSGTLNGNPLSAAAGLAMTDVLIEENGPAKLHAIGAAIAEQLRDCARRLSIPFTMIGAPAYAAPVFVEHPVRDFASYARSSQGAARQFCLEMMKRGVYVHSKWYVSTVHTEDDIAKTRAAAFEAMRAVRDAGLLQ